MYDLMMYVYQLSQLQEELRRKCVAYQSSSEENLQLQHSMQNQHTMLQESTSRIAQLEESQSQLQSQVHTPGFTSHGCGKPGNILEFLMWFKRSFFPML